MSVCSINPNKSYTFTDDERLYMLKVATANIDNVIVEKSDKLLYDVVFIGLTTDRNILYNRINKRVDEMVKEGLLEEAKKIYDSKIRTKAVLTPIGYKELFPYFENKASLDECLDLIKLRSRRYAKRQYTWNNHQIKVNWFTTNYDDFNQTVEEVKKFIGGIK